MNYPYAQYWWGSADLVTGLHVSTTMSMHCCNCLSLYLSPGTGYRKKNYSNAPLSTQSNCKLKHKVILVINCSRFPSPTVLTWSRHWTMDIGGLRWERGVKSSTPLLHFKWSNCKRHISSITRGQKWDMLQRTRDVTSKGTLAVISTTMHTDDSGH